jgi:hypothetical protein
MTLHLEFAREIFRKELKRVKPEWWNWISENHSLKPFLVIGEFTLHIIPALSETLQRLRWKPKVRNRQAD